MGTLRAQLGRAPDVAPIEILRWLTGWALAAWIARLFARATGWRREADVRLDGDAVCIARRVLFWGRTVRESEEVYALGSLVGVRRHVRYPAVHLAIGACAFGVGMLVGAWLFLDALRTGIASLLVAAGIAVAAGAFLDLVLRTLVPGTRGRVTLEVDFGKGAHLRLVGVERSAADGFVADVARRLEAR